MWNKQGHAGAALGGEGFAHTAVDLLEDLWNELVIDCTVQLGALSVDAPSRLELCIMPPRLNIGRLSPEWLRVVFIHLILGSDRMTQSLQLRLQG